MTPISQSPLNVELAAEAELATRFGPFVLRAYRAGEQECVALLKGSVANQSEVLTRIQSSCLLSESFYATDCDCAWQVATALRRISKASRGVFIYLFQEGRGIGIVEKIRALGVEQTQGVDTVEAFLLLGLPSPDLRTYEVAASVLLFERVKTVRLLTNNERKLKALSEYGIPTSPEALQLGEREFRELTQQMSNKELEHFAGYLQVKGTKLGQTLGLDFVHRILHDRGIDDAPPA